MYNNPIQIYCLSETKESRKGHTRAVRTLKRMCREGSENNNAAHNDNDDNDESFSDCGWVTYVHKPAKQKGRGASGGVGIIIRNDLGCIKRRKIADEPEGIIWASVDNNKWERGVLIASTYLNCIGSRHAERDGDKLILENIRKTIIKYGEEYDIMVGGDFNMSIAGRSSEPHRADLNELNNIETNCMEMIHWMHAAERDHTEFERTGATERADPRKLIRGSKVMDCMDFLNMVVLNGLHGKGNGLTFSRGETATLLDYAFTQEHLVPLSTFHTTDFSAGSDHTMIAIENLRALKADPTVNADGTIDTNENQDRGAAPPRLNLSKHDIDKCYKPLREALDEQLTRNHTYEALDECESIDANTLPSARRTLINRLNKDLLQALYKGSADTLPKHRERKTNQPNSESNGVTRAITKTIGKEATRILRRKRRTERELLAAREKGGNNINHVRRLERELEQWKKRLKKTSRMAMEKNRVKRLTDLCKIRAKNGRLFWRAVKMDGGWKEKTTKCFPSKVIDGVGRTLTDMHSILEQGRLHQKKLGNDNIDDERFDKHHAVSVRQQVDNIRKGTTIDDSNAPAPAMDELISEEEFDAAVKQLKNLKAPGLDGVWNEMIKHGGDRLRSILLRMFNACWSSGTVPEDWLTVNVRLLYKNKGSKNDFGNYRGLALQSNICKLFTRIMNNRLMEWLKDEQIISDTQAGFQKGRSCTEQLNAVNDCIITQWEKGQPLYALFYDCAKAYDTVDRASLLLKLWNYGIRGRMWRMIDTLYTNTKASISHNQHRSLIYEILQGVKQGCNLSPALYALFLNDLSRVLKTVDAGIWVKGAGEGDATRVNHLLYADDLILLAESQAQLQKLADIVTEYAHKWRFEMNLKKTKVVVFEEEPSHRQQTCRITTRGRVIDMAQGYKYLGVHFSAFRRNRWEQHKEDVLGRIRKCINVSHNFGTRKGKLPVKVAKLVFTALIRPTMDHGVEVWGPDDWPEAEVLQRKFYRQLVNGSSSFPILALEGDLGFAPMYKRWEMLKIRFMIRMMKMKGSIAAEIFRKESLDPLLQYEVLNSMDRERLIPREPPLASMKTSWKCAKIIQKWGREGNISLKRGLDLIKLVYSPNMSDEEASEARMMVRLLHTDSVKWSWIKRTENSGCSYIEWYTSLKEGWHGDVEDYLLDSSNWIGTMNIAKMRANVLSTLEVVRRAWGKDRLPREERVCPWCVPEKVEDPMHHLNECSAFSDVRKTFLTELSRIDLSDAPQMIKSIAGGEVSNLHKLILMSGRNKDGFWRIPDKKLRKKIMVLRKEYVRNLHYARKERIIMLEEALELMM